MQKIIMHQYMFSPNFRYGTGGSKPQVSVPRKAMLCFKEIFNVWTSFEMHNIPCKMKSYYTALIMEHMNISKAFILPQAFYTNSIYVIIGLYSV